MRSFITKFLKSSHGNSAAEYGVLIALIVVAVLAALTALGDSANTAFSHVATSLAK